MREKLIEILRTSCAVGKDCHKSCIECTADHLIANGVTIPVKCKECKHYMTIHCTCDGCCISDDWYCADGERRTDA